jgi:hypothetical protein
MGRARQKHASKRRKPNRRVIEPGEYGSFSIRRLKRALDAEAKAKSKADGVLERNRLRAEQANNLPREERE